MHWLISNLVSSCSSVTFLTLERTKPQVWNNDVFILIYERILILCQTHSCACRPPLSLRTLHGPQRKKAQMSKRITSHAYQIHRETGQSTYRCIYRSFSFAHRSSFKWQNEKKNSLVGPGLLEFLPLLSDLCVQALLGHRHLPNNHREAICYGYNNAIFSKAYSDTYTLHVLLIVDMILYILHPSESQYFKD